MRPGLTMILGGARSGKSRLAERLCRKGADPVAFVATALAWDAEMRERIARHQADRPAEWQTFEMPEGAVEDAAHASPLPLILREAAEECRTVIIDCLTVYLARRLHSFYGEDDVIPRERQVAAEALVMADLAELVRAREETEIEVILVSNEVGSGIVPAYASGRLLRDISGLANQWLVERAARAYFVVAGVPIDLKAQGRV
jgi:adenosylcobinamide kinase / adenosylcobinamide-phosphate guanylyltransferase